MCSLIGCFTITALLTVATACGDDAGDSNSGARGPDSGKTGAVADAGKPWSPPPPLETAGPVECRDNGRMVTCQPQFGIAACCAEGGGCGSLTPLGNTCIADSNPGGIDESCDPITVAGFTLRGCCAPGGRCGGMAPLSGCVPREQLAGNPKPADCDYDPDNACVAIHALAVCDGNEDCDDGKVCAADFIGQRYSNYHCTDDLLGEEALAMSAMGAVSQICHPGDDCEVDGYQCLVNTAYQPSFAGRCRDTGMAVTDDRNGAGELNCGERVCDAATQKCCVPETAEGIDSASAYCIRLEDDCTCKPPENTSEMDAGPDP